MHDIVAANDNDFCLHFNGQLLYKSSYTHQQIVQATTTLAVVLAVV